LPGLTDTFSWLIFIVPKAALFLIIHL